MITAAYRFGSLLGSAGADWDFDTLDLQIDGVVFDGAVIVEQGKPSNRRFKARVPTSAFDGEAHTFVIVGPSGPLTEPISVDAPDLVANRYDSHAVVGGGLRVEGWVQDAADPERPVTLTASVDARAFHTFVPDEERPPVAAIYGGNVVCGFCIDVPDELVGRETRSFTIRTGDGQLIRGFPRDLDLDIAIENSLMSLSRSRSRLAERIEMHAPGSSE